MANNVVFVFFKLDDRDYPELLTILEKFMTERGVDTINAGPPPRPVEPAPTKPAPVDDVRPGTVVSPVNFREGPSKTAKIIRGLPTGTKVALISCADGWWRAKHGEIVGYIAAGFIRVSP